MSFDSLLIANRGEIACRIIRTARGLGLRTIAVYSEADADALHVRMADEARPIGPAPVGESYLSIDRILEAAEASGAQAIHPGYGFLSENAAFAAACEKAGLVFVGPPASAIAAMGNKAEAKRLMLEAGVPCVPGYQGEEQSDRAFGKAAGEIGFPVMVKAAAGGGGRGMRLVAKAAELKPALALARSEAANAFGSDELILEKAVLQPRHVEIQIFADGRGNVIHLGERDCSVQRRHQKIVEEAPSPAVDEKLRQKMGEAAVEAARAIGYRGAGTVEFLLDADSEFYFLEMNTRLQVEHPVTEMVTGLDLVAMQIDVSQGKKLPLSQHEVRLDGHAIEVRLYAEDPGADFLPASGDIALWLAPCGKGIRVDDGIETGGTVSPHYDPMLAKVIAHGPDRETARRRLLRALGETALLGFASNRDFLIDVVSREAFAKGEATTAFIAEQYGEDGPQPAETAFGDLALGAVLVWLARCERAMARAAVVSPILAGWSSTGRLRSVIRLRAGEEARDVAVSVAEGVHEVSLGEDTARIEVLERGTFPTSLRVDGARIDINHAMDDTDIHFATITRSVRLRHGEGAAGGASGAAASGRVTAPMHGRVIEIVAEAGAKVAKGDVLATLEAMKMQHAIAAGVDGRVTAVHAAAGDQVAAGDLLVEIEPDGEEAGAAAGASEEKA